MDAIFFTIGALCILTGMDMLLNLGTQRRAIFFWTKPIHKFMDKFLDQHIF